jgi:long-chain acyl-CoA synthetase
MSASPERAFGLETPEKHSRHYVYAHWPWWRPAQWTRSAFIELVMRPLVWFLANPRVVAPLALSAGVSEPILIVANHVTAYDGPLVQYALPGRLRRRIAIAMSGEMLDDFRHFRNPEPGLRYGRFFLFGPIAHFLVTALFNVFPLPRLRDFQRSFSHAGEALDRGYHVLLFPEGARSATGELARFRPGIGLLVKQSDTSVLPVAIRGLGDLKQNRRGWFRSGAIELRVGHPIRFALDATESSINEQLQSEVKRLLDENGPEKFRK